MPRRSDSPHDLLFRSFFTTTLLLLLLFLVVPGCDRNIEPYEPGEEPSPPDLARIFPGPPGSVGSEASAGEAQTAGTARGAMPPTRTGAVPPPESAGSGPAPIQGRIELAPELSQGAPTGGVLFVIARTQGAAGGPPLAVLRIAEPRFPLEFSIGPENVMVPGRRFEGPISLSARLDGDGNAMTREPRDLSSAAEESLAPGARDVRLVLGQGGGG